MITKSDVAFVNRMTVPQLCHWLETRARYVSIEGYKGYSKDELRSAVLTEIDAASALSRDRGDPAVTRAESWRN